MNIIRHPRRLAGAFASTAAIAAAVLALPVANASASCGSFTDTGGSCTLNGTVTLNPGQLGITTAPTDLNFGSATLDGAEQWLEDATTSGGDSSNAYTITDDTGTGDGWELTAAYDASTGPFTNTDSDSSDPDYGAQLVTLETNGAADTESDTAAPADAAGTDSTAATEDGVTYPATIPTTQTDSAYNPITIFNAGVGSGMGVNNITDQDWWLDVPDDAYSGDYTTTLDLDLNSGPTG